MARGRKPGFKMSDEHRVKIQNSNILNALVEHVEGNREMSSTQVTAGIALLKKVLPDMQSMDLDHTSSDGSMQPTTIILEAAAIEDDDESLH